MSKQNWLAGAMLAVAVTLSGHAALAQGRTLPGGASSLQETHGDWIVKCAVPDAATAPVCVLAQEQADSGTSQRVLAVELRPEGDGVAGTLVLPFGLALAAGVTLAIDEAGPSPALAFRTCLPGGCLVSLGFDAETVAALRIGTALKIEATADNGSPMAFSISLAGFSGALDRTAALLASPQ